jgi:hypothetical protein
VWEYLLKQLEIELHAAQAQVEKLEQQKMVLSSRAWSSRDHAERSNQVLSEAWTVLQKWQSRPSHYNKRGM